MDNGFVNLLKVAGLHIHTMKTDVIFMLFGDPMYVHSRDVQGM